MKKNRTKHSPVFKAKVALAVLREQETASLDKSMKLQQGLRVGAVWVLLCLAKQLHGDVLRSLSKKKMYGSPNSNPSPELGADKENHTSWERYYQVSDCSSSLRNDWYSGI